MVTYVFHTDIGHEMAVMGYPLGDNVPRAGERWKFVSLNGRSVTKNGTPIIIDGSPVTLPPGDMFLTLRRESDGVTYQISFKRLKQHADRIHGYSSTG